MDSASGFFQITEPVNGRGPTKAVMRKRAAEFLRDTRSGGTLEVMVRQVVLATGLHHLLPDRYDRFRKVVVEGMVFMISSLPISRLAEKVVDQVGLGPDATPGERLYALISDMPSMQKLGQIICRSPGLDDRFRKVLTDLEDNIRTVTYSRMAPLLKREMGALPRGMEVVPERRILAEATVCAVIPAVVKGPGGGPPLKVALKAVKPAVRRNMEAELIMLDRLMAFLDQNQERWGLGEFNFTGTLLQVRKLLENEVDLASEQRNLDLARRYYGADRELKVPQRLEISTPRMTVMTRVDGSKITDVAGLTRRERRILATSLARICVLRPIQDMRGESLFHGDPHAGNISYTFEGSRPTIIFYDWGMLGRLKRLERIAMVLLTLGLALGNRMLIFYTADIITRGQISSGRPMRERITAIIDQAIQGHRAGDRGLLSSMEFLFERFTYQGVVFSRDLLMYEKALVTLKGVLADVDPTFDRDEFMVWAALKTFLDDVVRLRLLGLLIREAWRLYRHSLSVMMDIQKVMAWAVLDAGRLWLRLPRMLST